MRNVPLFRRALTRALFTLAVAAPLTIPASSRAALTDTPALKKCDAGIAGALRSCFAKVSKETGTCYLSTGSACASGDKKIDAALAKVEKIVDKRCADDATVQALGYGPLFTRAGLVSRLQEACTAETAALAARTFGGPLGTLLVGADEPTLTCLETGYTEGVKLIKTAYNMRSACARKAHKGKTCDPDKVEAKISQMSAKREAKITAACAFPALEDLTGLDEEAFGSRALAQSRCMTATAHADVGPLSLDCGPRSSVPVPPRGVWTQVVLDKAVWGTQCGDGSDYAFWLRLAPEGSPVQQAIVNLQGGGVCIFNGLAPDCATTSPDLFEALSDYLPSGPTGGWLNTSAAINPFSNWTMMALPYCTQDVFIGGGVDNVFSPTLTVHRYGAPNTRAALQYLRDVLWAEMDATTAEGYRPDLMRVLFGGESAGGFGVEYNYHYVLDDLGWIHTTAVPDSALALDSGSFGVSVLGAIVTDPNTPSLFWNVMPFQPPYCLGSNCAVVFPNLANATSPRLKAYPDQQVLNLSNQVDDGQRSTTNFATMVDWTNAARAAYCGAKSLNGEHFFLPAVSTSIHTMVQDDTLFTTLSAGGVTLRDWLSNAVANPDSLSNEVDEGTITTDIPGVNPFPCSIP